MSILVLRKPVIPTSYTANLSAALNSTIWRGGATVGLDWTDVSAGSGLASASSGSLTNEQDSLAVLTTNGFAIPADQEVVVTIHKGGGAPSTHEVELLLRWGMSAHSAPGVEILIPYSGSFQIVRQNGTLHDYNFINGGSGTGLNGDNIADGDQIRAKIVGNTITIYHKGVQVWTVTDATVPASGSPGMGFYCSGGGTPTNHCISSWYAGPAT